MGVAVVKLYQNRTVMHSVVVFIGPRVGLGGGLLADVYQKVSRAARAEPSNSSNELHQHGSSKFCCIG